jgi:hypothetical protein
MLGYIGEAALKGVILFGYAYIFAHILAWALGIGG